MEVHPTTTEAGGDGAAPYTVTDDERREQARGLFWQSLATLYRRKWFIIGATFLAGVVSIALSLTLPLWYASTARVLPPESSGGGLSSLIGEISPLASSLVGGGGGDYTRYLAILEARSTREQVVDEFDLVDVYQLEGERFPREEALEDLSANLAIEVDLKLDYLSITAFDTDPDRAARMANYLVELLNERNADLALESASAYRRYVEERYQEIEVRLDSARSEMQAFQERYGVIELPAMAQSFMESLALARAATASAEIEYRALLSELGSENPQVQAAQEAYQTARRAESDLVGGREALMPVPIQNLPAVGANYARVYQEVMIQQTLLENARPLLEQARFDEERERTAVQVLDPAVPAVRKAKPKRSVIVILATFSVFLLSVVFVLLWAWWRENHSRIAHALRQPAA